MADPKVSNAADRAEQAYAAAAEVVEAKPAEAKPIDTPPVEFPAKAKRGPQAGPAAKTTNPVQAAVERAKIEPAKIEPAKIEPAKIEPAKIEPAKAGPTSVKPAAAKPLPPRPKPARTQISTPVTATTDKPKLSQSPKFSQSKDKTMATQTTDFTARDTTTGFKDVFADVKTKAKAAFEKGASSLGDYTDFAKGNVEAAVESGKIFAAGLQELGGTYVAESKTAFEALTADAKELAAQKTPTDFFKVQSEIARKNFESAMAFGTKSSEAWMKLAGEAFAPLSGRVNLAVEKIKTTA